MKEYIVIYRDRLGYHERNFRYMKKRAIAFYNKLSKNPNEPVAFVELWIRNNCDEDDEEMLEGYYAEG